MARTDQKSHKWDDIWLGRWSCWFRFGRKRPNDDCDSRKDSRVANTTVDGQLTASWRRLRQKRLVAAEGDLIEQSVKTRKFWRHGHFYDDWGQRNDKSKWGDQESGCQYRLVRAWRQHTNVWSWVYEAKAYPRVEPSGQAKRLREMGHIRHDWNVCLAWKTSIRWFNKGINQQAIVKRWKNVRQQSTSVLDTKYDSKDCPFRGLGETTWTNQAQTRLEWRLRRASNDCWKEGVKKAQSKVWGHLQSDTHEDG